MSLFEKERKILATFYNTVTIEATTDDPNLLKSRQVSEG